MYSTTSSSSITIKAINESRVQLPAEIKLKIASLLSGDFKSLTTLEEVFPHEMANKHVLYSEQAIFIGGHELHCPAREPCELPFGNIHRFDDVLFKKDQYFRFPVKQLSLFMDPEDLGDELVLKIICQIFSKEPCLQAVRVLKLNGYTENSENYLCQETSRCRQRMLHEYQRSQRTHSEIVASAIAALKKFDSKKFNSKRFNSKRRPTYSLIDDISPVDWEVPEPIDYERVKITCSPNESCFSKILSNLQHLKELQYHECSPVQIEGTKIRQKLLKLESLKIDHSYSLIDPNFDKYVPNLKFLDLWDGGARNIFKFPHTESLEELHFWIPLWMAEDSIFENLSRLKNLKKLVIGGCETLDGIMHLKSLQYLCMIDAYYGFDSSIAFALDHNLPSNLKVLLIYGYGDIDIINLPLSFQKLEITKRDTIRNYIFIDCNMSYRKSEIINQYYRLQVFTFGDESSFHKEQEEKAFIDSSHKKLKLAQRPS